jgi:hypothetical protein
MTEGQWQSRANWIHLAVARQPHRDPWAAAKDIAESWFQLHGGESRATVSEDAPTGKFSRPGK